MGVDRPAPDNPFAAFFQDPLYLQFKNHLYNYRLRRHEIRKELAKVRNPGLVLEIGSGVSTMTEGGPGIVFSDISWEAVRYLKEKRIAHHALVMSVTGLALQNESVGTVVCSEVLEHVKDDDKALREINRILKPGGSLILTVPVHPRYYGFDDRYVKHERRYAVRPLYRKLHALGFEKLRPVKVTGILDKLATIAMTGIYALFAGTGKTPGRPSRFFLTLFLPAYKALNWIYSGIVSLEARLMPLAMTAVLLIHCRKKEDGRAYEGV